MKLPFPIQQNTGSIRLFQRREFFASAVIGGTAAILADTSKAAPSTPKKNPKLKLFTTPRKDGRFLDTAGFLHHSLKSDSPKLAFDPNMKAEDFPAWQKAVRSKLLELMAFPEVPEQPEPKRLWLRKRKGYVLQKWEAYPEPGSVVPFVLVIPDGADRRSPAPAVMCFPGSTGSLESLIGEPEVFPKAKLKAKKSPDWKLRDNRMALHFSRRGMIGVAVANPATNDTDSPIRSRSEMAMNAIAMGRSYLGISSFQKAHILEWVSRQNFVDKKRIAVCGHSLGSEPNDVLGVLYPKLIKAVIHNDFCCNWIERSIALNGLPLSPHHMIPGMFEWFDATDLEASIAPLPLLFTEGGRANQLKKIRTAYRMNGAEDKMKVFQYTKYIDPAARKYDFKPISEGLTMEQYFEYANVDVEEHCFRPKRAVPWLANQFGLA